MTMFNPKHTFLILMLSLVLAASSIADDNAKYDSPPYSFWIGIHNTEVFYEYKYSETVLQRVNEGRVTEVKGESTTRFELWTPPIRISTAGKAQKRDLLRTKYRNSLPLYQYSIVEQSDDGRFIAYTSDYNDKSISIVSIPDKRQVRIDPKGKRGIADTLWLDGSRAIVLLTRSERTGCLPHEIVKAISGHPVPHNSFYLEIYTPDGSLIKELPIMDDITYGLGVLTK